MKRFKNGAFGGATLLAAALLTAGMVPAQVRAAEAADAMPLRDVVMFSSGVGYFQRAGKVNGNTTIPLTFRAEQINDILKSLVIFDPAGSVRPVTYTTKDSISRRLQSAGLSLNGTVTLGGLLRGFQGARVRVETGGEAVEGRILSVSYKNVPAPLPGREGAVIQTEILNVMTDTGLRAIPLDGVTQVRLLDERLDRELRESLALLATGLDDQRRAVELHFGGNKEREARAGYLQEMPVWKTSYRLVLDDKAKPYLQGWAIVENTTDEDWREVNLSLVSGRPISFVQDLYQPLYVPRPRVAPQIIGSPLPQTYGESLSESKDAAAAGDKQMQLRKGEASGGGRGSGGRANAMPGAAPAMALADSDNVAEFRREMGMSAAMLAQSVGAQAQGSERGELFEYAIRQPVTLPKQQAAMVPIVGENIEGEKVSIFDPDSDATHALNGVRLKNTTALHLAGGPVTVFDDGVYAGDGQFNNVQPNETRLISYAVDLDLVVGRQGPNYNQELLALSVKSGVLTMTRKQINARVYTFRNKSKTAKTVLIQQPLEPEFKLVTPKEPYEKTPASNRFKVEVPADKSVEYRVVSERPLVEGIALINADINMLAEWSKNGPASERLKAALAQLVAHRRKITELQNQRTTLENELRAIDQEQSRIRQNMGQLDRTNALYNQYVKKLTDQEERIEKVKTEIIRLREAELAAQKEMQAYVDTLTVE